jgi:hypothetical protein
MGMLSGCATEQKHVNVIGPHGGGTSTNLGCILDRGQVCHGQVCHGQIGRGEYIPNIGSALGQEPRSGHKGVRDEFFFQEQGQAV